MADEPLQYKKDNGVFYTPPNLAEVLVKPLVHKVTISVFDPAYGEGALLLAAEKVFYQNHIVGNELSLFGCDIQPVNGLLEHIPEANLQEQDFFDYSLEQRYDVILTNPPYIRHQKQDKKLISKYRSQNPGLDFLSNSSDLWAYFIVKCVSHLNEGGAMGAILPWALLQADYAKPLRVWLAKNFGRIRVLALNNEFFDDADERIVLIWLEEYGNGLNKIEIAYSEDIKNEISYKEISTIEWSSKKVLPYTDIGIDSILDKLVSEHSCFSKLGQHAVAKLGIVTGANSFFVLSNQQINEYGLGRSLQMPILTSSKDFTGLLSEGTGVLKRLLVLNSDDEPSFVDYLTIGIGNEIHKRSHCKARRVWYSIDPGDVPGAFFPYRVSKIPHMILNSAQIQSTNSVHRIYFKNCSEVNKEWIFVSMLTVYAQLSILAYSKSYGRGMVKVEPGVLKYVLVVKQDDQSITDIYQSLVRKLGLGRKYEAVLEATDYIDFKMKIPNQIRQRAMDMWERIIKK